MSVDTTERPSVLCVDDEPHVLEGLGRHLRLHFRVATAPSGAAGLDAIARDGPFAVVVSDMRMPGMDGAVFLRHVREKAPDTVRLLLTGHADLDAAIAAVNEANIFRFLCKPCAPDVLLTALAAAAEQHRLVTTERVLLRETLQGSIRMLTEVLALASPLAFGRATRAKQVVSQVIGRLGSPDGWAVEVAAMLSQIGCVTLPDGTAEKLYHGRPLDPEERVLIDRLPGLAAQLLGNIPRLGPVRDILRDQDKRFDVGGAGIPWGARLLKIVLDWDALEAQGLAIALVLQTLLGRAGCYDPELLRVVGDVLGAAAGTVEVRELPLSEVQLGMVFAEDVVSTRSGMILIARGQEVTASLVERIRNFSSTIGVREPVRLLVPPAEAAVMPGDTPARRQA
jgi:response regulator RpfG family c-di-GMP phosphodiesterase